MRKLLILLPLIALFITAFAYVAPAENEKSESKLSLVCVDNIASVFTPGHLKRQLIASMDLPNGEGRGIKCSVSEQSVVVDTDLDGNPDTKVVSNNKIVEITLKKGDEGKKYKYWVMISFDPRYTQRQWFYESATAATGTVNGKKILIVDDNCNGNFADYGVDGVIVAPSEAGWFLSTAIDTGKDLIEVDVDPDGTSLSYRLFFGDTGTIDPFKKLDKAKFKPQVFVVKQSDRSFNVIRPDGKPSSVPVGTYNIERGVIDRLTEFVGSKHPPFDVLKDNVTTVEWGGPFTFLFFESPAPDYPPAGYVAKDDIHTFLLEPPYVKGEKGEVYVGSKTWCDPERDLNQKKFYIAEQMAFNIEILDVKTKKSLNKNKFYSGGQPPPSQDAPAPYYWTIFSWPYGDLRGKYILRVTSPQSRNFKTAIYEQLIELK